MAPHNPLSVVTGTVTFFSPAASGKSPSIFRNGSCIPLHFSVADCALLIFDAATIFIALVIFWMLPTDRIRCFTANVDTEREAPLHHTNIISVSTLSQIYQQTTSRAPSPLPYSVYGRRVIFPTKSKNISKHLTSHPRGFSPQKKRGVASCVLRPRVIHPMSTRVPISKGHRVKHECTNSSR